MPVSVDAKTGAKRQWQPAVPLKDAALERLLERLDAVVRLVEPICEEIEDRLGVADAVLTEEEEDSDVECN